MNITLKNTAIAAAMGLALALSTSAALAQANTGSRMTSQAYQAAEQARAQAGQAQAKAEEMSTAVVNAHKADLDNMLKDMAKVNSKDVAVGYEGYLNSQINAYVNNHKRLNAAIPSVGIAKRMGKFNPDMRNAVDAINALNDKQYTQVAAEMDRIEKLHPNLKKQFDILRDLND